MNARVVISAIVIFAVCSIVVKADGDCFDMEKFKKEETEESMKSKKLMIEGLKKSCEGKEDEKACIKEKILGFISAMYVKKEAKKYLKDASKEESINNLIDECFKDKPTFFKCYAEKMVALCPDTKEAMEKAKKEHPSFFE